MKVYIKCPPRLVTGGPEFLHQVCAGLRDNGIDAYIFYENEFSPNPQAACYTTRYNNPYVTSIPDTPAAALIVPEIYVSSLFNTRYKKFKKLILWESVNFYLTQVPVFLLNIFPENTIHLYQSQYAKDFLTFARVPEKDQIPITDYISEEFLNIQNIQIDDSKKENLISFYVPKGNEFTLVVLQHLKKKYNYQFLPLENYSTEELINIFTRSKVFLDFGYFPGKNRMYREASTCRNIIFTSPFGAARDKRDVNIKDKYKIFPNDDNIIVAENRIKECIENFDKYIIDFDELREEVFKEKEVFDKNIKVLADRLREE